uniref:Uncharacterized protein n=1 Tax=Plectus sambesii TaxID=2011161 RepID=A0A914WPQ3_9BILA
MKEDKKNVPLPQPPYEMAEKRDERQLRKQTLLTQIARNSMFGALEALKKEKRLMQPCILAFTQTGAMEEKFSDLFVIMDAKPIAFFDAAVSISVTPLFVSIFSFNF